MRIAIVTTLLATLGLFTQPPSNAVMPLSIEVSVRPTQGGPYELLRAPQGAKYTLYVTVRDASSRKSYLNAALPVPKSGHDTARAHTQWFDATFGVNMKDRACETTVVIEHEGKIWDEQKNAMAFTSPSPSSSSPNPR